MADSDKGFWLQCVHQGVQGFDVTGPFDNSDDFLIIETIKALYRQQGVNIPKTRMIEEKTIKDSMAQIKTTIGSEMIFNDRSLLFVKQVFDDNKLSKDMWSESAWLYSTQIRRLPEFLWLDNEKTLEQHLQKHYMHQTAIRGDVEKIVTDHSLDDAMKRAEGILEAEKMNKRRVWEFNPPLSLNSFRVLGCYDESPRELPRKMVVIQINHATPESRSLGALGKGKKVRTPAAEPQLWPSFLRLW